MTSNENTDVCTKCGGCDCEGTYDKRCATLAWREYEEDIDMIIELLGYNP